MLPIPKFILYLAKNSKMHKIHCFSFESWISLFIPDLLFFSHKIKPKKKLHANVPEMFNFNSKTSI